MKLHININKGNKNFIKEDEGGLFNSISDSLYLCTVRRPFISWTELACKSL